VIVWLSLTGFESALVGTSLSTQRVITLLFLVLPPGIGAVLGVLSFVRKEGRSRLATTSIILNVLFACFHTLIVLFAG
jgi:hypothetical protein